MVDSIYNEKFNMGRFEALKVTIDANIRENGNQEITGEVLNRVLNEMVSVTEEEVAEAAASGGGGGGGSVEGLAKVATTGSYDDLKDKPVFATINNKRIDQGGNIVIEGGEGGGGADLTEVNKKIADLTEETERLEADKQDTLVSGTNIKTINNQSILGKGNITIEGGSGGSVYYVYANETLTDEQKAVNKAAFDSVVAGEDASYYAIVNADGLECKVNIDMIINGGSVVAMSASFYSITLGGDEELINTTMITFYLNEDGSFFLLKIQDKKLPSAAKVEEMIAASIGDIKASIVAINGEEV